MSKRAQLHGLVRNLRQYLEWQAVPLAGSVPAPEDERQAWQSERRAREKAKLEASLNREPTAPPPQRTRTPESKPAAPASGGFSQERPTRKQPDPAPAGGGNALWKSGEFGAKPRKTFGSSDEGGDEASPTTQAQSAAPQTGGTPRAGAPTQASSKQASSKDTQHPTGKQERPSLKAVRAELGDCQRCGLCETRTNIVFGVGNPNAKIMFIGEAPGFNEDKQGEPFVGNAGNLLDKMIAGMTLKRGDVYIANVIKCRPPENRDPSPDEVRTCSPFLEKQVAAIEPAVIVALGKFASNMLTGNDGSLGSIRGRWHDYKGVPVMPTYHPAYLLRSPDQKGKAWDDLKKVMKKAGLEIPDRYR